MADRLFDQQWLQSARTDDAGLALERVEKSAAAMQESKEVLRLTGVRKTFGNSVVVENTDLTLRRGEILTLLGPSGCGKTTTLRMVIGLERATAGHIVFNGRTVDAPGERVFIPPEKRNMGMVFQSYAIWPHMTVYENIAYPLRIRRLPEAEIKQSVKTIIELVGLTGYEDRPGTKLSGGQQQRVAVARGLVYGPDLLLMDEPFSNLDVKLREQMRVEVKLLQRRLGISILFVTHDQSEALALSDRIALMRDGCIEQIGSPLELYSSPETPHARDFLGRTILFAGRVRAREGQAIVAAELDNGAVLRVAGRDQTGGASANARCVVGIRPEHVLVEPDECRSVGPRHNVLQGKILALLFMGNCYEAEVVLASKQVLTVYLPASPQWREQQNVRLVLPEAALSLWPEEK